MNRNDLNPVVRDDVALAVAIGVLETSSVARGIEVADAVLKEAQVELLFATPVQPGKYVMLYTGSVQDVRAATARGAQLLFLGLGRVLPRHGQNRVADEAEHQERDRGDGDDDEAGLSEARKNSADHGSRG